MPLQGKFAFYVPFPGRCLGLLYIALSARQNLMAGDPAREGGPTITKRARMDVPGRRASRPRTHRLLFAVIYFWGKRAVCSCNPAGKMELVG